MSLLRRIATTLAVPGVLGLVCASVVVPAPAFGLAAQGRTYSQKPTKDQDFVGWSDSNVTHEMVTTFRLPFFDCATSGTDPEVTPWEALVAPPGGAYTSAGVEMGCNGDEPYYETSVEVGNAGKLGYFPASPASANDLIRLELLPGGLGRPAVATAIDVTKSETTTFRAKAQTWSRAEVGVEGNVFTPVPSFGQLRFDISSTGGAFASSTPLQRDFWADGSTIGYAWPLHVDGDGAAHFTTFFPATSS